MSLLNWLLNIFELTTEEDNSSIASEITDFISRNAYYDVHLPSTDIANDFDTNHDDVGLKRETSTETSEKKDFVSRNCYYDVKNYDKVLEREASSSLSENENDPYSNDKAPYLSAVSLVFDSDSDARYFSFCDDSASNRTSMIDDEIFGSDVENLRDNLVRDSLFSPTIHPYSNHLDEGLNFPKKEESLPSFSNEDDETTRKPSKEQHETPSEQLEVNDEYFPRNEDGVIKREKQSDHSPGSEECNEEASPQIPNSVESPRSSPKAEKTLEKPMDNKDATTNEEWSENIGESDNKERSTGNVGDLMSNKPSIVDSGEEHRRMTSPSTDEDGVTYRVAKKPEMRSDSNESETSSELVSTADEEDTNEEFEISSENNESFVPNEQRMKALETSEPTSGKGNIEEEHPEETSNSKSSSSTDEENKMEGTETENAVDENHHMVVGVHTSTSSDISSTSESMPERHEPNHVQAPISEVPTSHLESDLNDVRAEEETFKDKPDLSASEGKKSSPESNAAIDIAQSKKYCRRSRTDTLDISKPRIKDERKLLSPLGSQELFALKDKRAAPIKSKQQSTMSNEADTKRIPYIRSKTEILIIPRYGNERDVRCPTPTGLKKRLDSRNLTSENNAKADEQSSTTKEMLKPLIPVKNRIEHADSDNAMNGRPKTRTRHHIRSKTEIIRLGKDDESKNKKAPGIENEFDMNMKKPVVIDKIEKLNAKLSDDRRRKNDFSHASNSLETVKKRDVIRDSKSRPEVCTSNEELISKPERVSSRSDEPHERKRRLHARSKTETLDNSKLLMDDNRTNDTPSKPPKSRARSKTENLSALKPEDGSDTKRFSTKKKRNQASPRKLDNIIDEEDMTNKSDSNERAEKQPSEVKEKFSVGKRRPDDSEKSNNSTSSEYKTIGPSSSDGDNLNDDGYSDTGFISSSIMLIDMAKLLPSIWKNIIVEPSVIGPTVDADDETITTDEESEIPTVTNSEQTNEDNKADSARKGGKSRRRRRMSSTSDDNRLARKGNERAEMHQPLLKKMHDKSVQTLTHVEENVRGLECNNMEASEVPADEVKHEQKFLDHSKQKDAPVKTFIEHSRRNKEKSIPMNHEVPKSNIGSTIPEFSSLPQNVNEESVQTTLHYAPCSDNFQFISSPIPNDLNNEDSEIKAFSRAQTLPRSKPLHTLRSPAFSTQYEGGRCFSSTSNEEHTYPFPSSRFSSYVNRRKFISHQASPFSTVFDHSSSLFNNRLTRYREPTDPTCWNLEYNSVKSDVNSVRIIPINVKRTQQRSDENRGCQSSDESSTYQRNPLSQLTYKRETPIFNHLPHSSLLNETFRTFDQRFVQRSYMSSTNNAVRPNFERNDILRPQFRNLYDFNFSK